MIGGAEAKTAVHDIAVEPGNPTTILLITRVFASNRSALMPDEVEPPFNAIGLLTKAGPRVPERTKRTIPPLQVALFFAITFWTISASDLLTDQIVPPFMRQLKSVAVLAVIVLPKMRGAPAPFMPIALPLPAVFPVIRLFATTAAPPLPSSETPPPELSVGGPNCEQSARLAVIVFPEMTGDPSPT